MSSDIRQMLKKELEKQNYIVDWVDLASKEVLYCNGCNHCWSVKPGVCAKNDDMVDIFPKLANSELQIFITSISFGGFNSDLNKVLDRYVAMGVPTYRVYKGQLHHPVRYPNPELFMTIGILRNKNGRQEKTFELTSERMATCFYAKKAAAVVLKEETEVHENLQKVKIGLEKIEVNV
ncbi:MAG: hypothetical protein ACOC3B_02550 [Bacillota bacterium]